MKPWEIVSSRTVLQNRWIAVRQDQCRMPDGRLVDEYNVIVENNIVSVVALTPERRILLCEQYKHALGDTTFELPGGIFDSRDGDPEAEARRELLEETGCTADTFHLLSTLSVSPARLAQRLYMYAAPNVVRIAEQDLDEQEEIRVHALPVEEVEAMIRDGRICASTTIAGLHLGLDYLRRGGWL